MLTLLCFNASMASNPMPSQRNFCFSTLALGERYSLMARSLAEDLQKYASGAVLVVYTSHPQVFERVPNVMAFKHQQQAVLHCYHDKRFAIAKALSLFPSVIQVDADTRIQQEIPTDLEFPPGIVARHRNLIEHNQKYRPQLLPGLETAARKMDLDLKAVEFIGESIFIVSRDHGKEQDFIKYWGLLGDYMQLRGYYGGEGSILGLAAAKAGWQVTTTPAWEMLHAARHHLDASQSQNQTDWWVNLKQRLSYHYRLNRLRLVSLSNFNFYYR